MRKQIKESLREALSEIFWLLHKHFPYPADQPTEVHLLVTENCCLQCRMCDIWRIEKKQKPLDYKTGKRIIDKLFSWLGIFNLSFAGGEPFLNREVIKIINYARKKGIKTGINSNGYIIDKKYARAICESGLSTIFFSLDGEEKAHDYIRGQKGSFNRVINAIRFIQDSKGEKKPEVFINCVISRNNISRLREIIKIARKVGVRGINFQVLMPNFASVYRSNWWKTNSLWPRDKKIINWAIDGLKSEKKLGGDFILNSYRDLDNFRNYLIDPARFQKNQRCYVGLNNLMLDTSGNMKLCYEMRAIGNIILGDPQKIWNSPEATIIRDSISKCQRPCKLLPCNVAYYGNLIKRKLRNLNKLIRIGVS